MEKIEYIYKSLEYLLYLSNTRDSYHCSNCLLTVEISDKTGI